MLSTAATLRSVTVPGFVVVGGGGGGGGEPPVTVIVALPDFPWLVAVISEVPAATHITRPESETVAMFGLLDVQATGR